MYKKIPSMIDHTMLSPTATTKDIKKLCEEANHYSFASVCVNPFYVSLAKELITNNKVKVCAVVGFPLGMNRREMIVEETKKAVLDGAKEIDMVINQGALKEGNKQVVYDGILDIKNSLDNEVLKVILETTNLTDEEIVAACEIAIKAGANFVKTSTGFLGGGATIHHVKLMKETIGHRAEVKASGGIKNLKTAMAMINAGATRIGTSSGVKIIEESILK